MGNFPGNYLGMGNNWVIPGELPGKLPMNYPLVPHWGGTEIPQFPDVPWDRQGDLSLPGISPGNSRVICN